MPFTAVFFYKTITFLLPTIAMQHLDIYNSNMCQLKIKFTLFIAIIYCIQIVTHAKTVDDVVDHNLFFRDSFNQNVTEFKHANMFDRSTVTPHNFHFNHKDIISLTISSPLPITQENEWYDGDKIVGHRYQGKLKAYFFETAEDGEKKRVIKELTFTYKKANIKRERPVVFTFPPIMGETMAEKRVGLALLNRDIDVILPEMPNFFNPKNSLNNLVNDIPNYIIGIKMLIHLLESEEIFQDVNSSKIGVVGMSLGAIISSILVGATDNVTTAVIVAGGGNLPDIIVNSTQESIVDFRNAAFKRNKIFKVLSETEKKAKLYSYAKNNFSFDPLYFADRATHKDIYMVIGVDDKTIPTKGQIELYNMLQAPAHDLSSLSHISTCVRWAIRYASDGALFFRNSFEKL